MFSSMFSSPIPGRVAPKGREPSLPGDKWNRLTLIAEVPGQNVRASVRRWLCLCDCGVEKAVILDSLKSGNSGSCGCLNAGRDTLTSNFSSPVLGRNAPIGREPNLPCDKYNRLTLVSEVPGQTGSPSKRRWLCRCDCGTSTIVVLDNMRSGNSGSCGCLNIEIATKCNTTHGFACTRTHNVWKGVVQRCTNPSHERWADYGLRGISVCDEWRNSFENFLTDMGECPEGLSLDRINNNLGYNKDNCQWATPTQQARNQRSNRLVSYQGHNICLAEAVEIAELHYNTVSSRLNIYGWTIPRALNSTEFGEPLPI